MVRALKYIRMISLNPFQDNSKQCSMKPELDFILMFDIDHCLYYNETCKRAEVESNSKTERILMANCNKRPKTLKELKKEYGSSREGIQQYYEKSMDYVMKHDFNDVCRYIERNDELIDEFDDLPFKKYCFTNGFPKKAKEILQKLELENYFEAVFCCNDNFEKDDIWITKPKPEAFVFVEKYLNLNDCGKKIVFFDDSIENIEMAKQFNWITYHVTPKDDIIERINQFKREHCYPEVKKPTFHRMSSAISA